MAPRLPPTGRQVFLEPTQQKGESTLLLVSHDSASGGIHITWLAQGQKPVTMSTGTYGLIRQVSGPATYQVVFNGDQLVISN